VRTARRFISKTKHPLPIDKMTFFEMGKHTPPEQIKNYFETLTDGNDVGLLSEAGTPCVADPGAIVVGTAHDKGINVIPLVGPSSIILALMTSGFNGQNFAFHGYLPVNKNELINKLKDLEQQIIKNDQTQIFIETPFRNNQLLEMIKNTCKPGTHLCVAYNLTLPGERIISSTIQEWKKKILDFNKKPAVFLLYS